MVYTRAYYEEKINASADQVWAEFGAFNSLPAILPKLVAKSELDKTGLIRCLTIKDKDGTRYKRYERLIKYDALTHTLIYELIDKANSRVPVKNYTATIKVRKEEVRPLVEKVYADGIAGGRALLGRLVRALPSQVRHTEGGAAAGREGLRRRHRRRE